MANENPSRENPSRQQTSERAQSGSTTSQQGAGAGGQRGSPGTSGSYGQGSATQGGRGQESYGQGGSGQGRQGVSTWQGGRSGQSGGALEQRGGSSMSPYASNYGAGYGSGPFSIMRRISDEMDRFFENFGMGRSLLSGQDQGGWGAGEQGTWNAPSIWSPHIEVGERNGKLVIKADLPGIKRDDINVRIEQDQVIIQGERQQEQTNNQSGYYRSERSYGSFYRTIPLPEGTDADSATASFRDGVLEIELDAPRQQQRGRTLEIRDGGSGARGSAGGGPMQGQAGQVGTGSGSTYGGASQQAASGTTGSQQSGSGTTYSGSGNPSTGAAGTGSGTPSGTSDRPGDKSRGSDV